jgi:SAM-dependent methyltransferase
MLRDRCLTCDSSDLLEIFDLGLHPMADTFIALERAPHIDRKFPLICDLCGECGMVQLRVVTDPRERYVDAEYSYTSSNSSMSRRHWTEYAVDVTARAATPQRATIVEVGSNDGFLSAALSRLGHSVLGVDPSPCMAALATERGVQTLQSFFDAHAADALRRRLGDYADLIVANNVVNHANDLGAFIQAVKSLLHPQGTFVFELPYWLNTVRDRKFDQIYHEHVTYFTLNSALGLLKRHDMHLSDAELVDYHGGSLRMYVRHGAKTTVAPNVSRLVDAEVEAGLRDPNTYKRFVAAIRDMREAFLGIVERLHRDGKPIVCVGAAAKGNTFLNYYGLDSTVIDCVTDASPVKQGKMTPGTRIPITNDEALSRYDEVYAIVLAWNLLAAMRANLLRINARIKFLNPYEKAA